MADPVTKEALIEWIGDRTGEYDYYNNTDCPLARFLKEQGCWNVRVYGWNYFHHDGFGEVYEKIPNSISDALAGRPHEWEALKTRLQAIA